MADELPPPPDLASAEALVRARQAMFDRIDKQVKGVETVLAKDPSAARALSAMASLVRQLRLAEDALVRAEWVAYTYRQTNPEDLPEEDYVEELRNAAEGMVEDHLRVFVDTWLERHGMMAVAMDENARKRFDAIIPRTRTQET